jgi:hypothetical protein
VNGYSTGVAFDRLTNAPKSSILVCLVWNEGNRGFRGGFLRPDRRRVDFEAQHIQRAPLAQLDRASDYGSEGREFESLRAHQNSTLLLKT